MLFRVFRFKGAVKIRFFQDYVKAGCYLSANVYLIFLFYTENRKFAYGCNNIVIITITAY